MLFEWPESFSNVFLGSFVREECPVYLHPFDLIRYALSLIHSIFQENLRFHLHLFEATVIVERPTATPCQPFPAVFQEQGH